MNYEILVALHVADQEAYAEYRREIAPLLQSAGAAFTYDLDVSRARENASPHDINRLFVLRFPSKTAHDRFFADPSYRGVRARHFENAVKGFTVIAEYERD